ncbi:hypothetical protein BMI91_17895 [Thioclava sediminum]|jgi:hypothetical protein|uniref:PH domain-containing protein n=2 Tax=Thioclava TaxID=285107 RepID=A0ABX3MS73_9RHOB|nr:hypothetical protein [Thioclava sp.]OOY22544.1 hypothetical protein BMI91_17895 [Thioclava sediminum]
MGSTMDDNEFEYRHQARRAGGYLALAFGMALLYGAMKLTATTWIHVAAWIYLALTLYKLMRNRSGLLRITPARMEVYRNGRQLGTFPLAQIDSARLRRRKLAGDECMVTLRDGRRAYLPREATPPLDRLSAIFESYGVPVV